jgi:hypothetical protein
LPRRSHNCCSNALFWVLLEEDLIKLTSKGLKSISKQSAPLTNIRRHQKVQFCRKTQQLTNEVRSTTFYNRMLNMLVHPKTQKKPFKLGILIQAPNKLYTYLPWVVI